jgi:proteasome lid subunit RPN8/RPN11
VILLDEQLLAEIHRIGEERAPEEACGIILPETNANPRVIELKNHCDNTHNGFLIRSSDLRAALGDWIYTTSMSEELTIWHTHPGGGVGPSRMDMQNKVNGLNHLVVTLTAMGPVASWY